MERPGIIKPEIAELYGVPPGTVNDWVRAADWPEPIGKRGRFVEYDRADVVAAVVGRRFHKVPDTVKALGSQPLTQQEIAELFGLDYGTVRVDASRGGSASRWSRTACGCSPPTRSPRSSPSVAPIARHRHRLPSSGADAPVRAYPMRHGYRPGITAFFHEVVANSATSVV
ncbi:hypothetical protein ACFQ9X_12050 [Catenulispora yoronensis]